MSPFARALTPRTLVAVAILSCTVAAQPSARRATNVATLLAHPGFYHLRPVIVVGEITLSDSGERRLESDAGSLRVVSKVNVPEGLAEVRGEFWDVGRMNADDPRLAGYDLRSTFQIEPDGAWPRSGQVTAVVASAITPASPPLTPSIRAIVLQPSRFVDEQVTISGQFAGRNLLGDLPDGPALSRWDFVLRTADAAIWVTNMRPRGRDFELALDARIDTGRWLEVTGVVQQGRGLQWLDAEDGRLALTKRPEETPDAEPIRVPAAPPPEVVFSAPLTGETDVPTSTNVRIQFSRDIDAATFKDHVNVSYLEEETRKRAELDTPIVDFTTSYLPGNRVLEIRFAQPLERFRTVRVELRDTILGTDRQPLTPAVISFTTGS